VYADGLYQDLTSDEVVQCVGEYLKLKAESTAQPRLSASSYLIRRVLYRAAQHAFRHVTFSSEREALSVILQLRRDVKRNVHDDITVIVIFLDAAGVPTSLVGSTAAGLDGAQAKARLRASL